MGKPLLHWVVSDVAKGKSADVDIFDIIGDPWEGVSAGDFVKDLRALDVERINFYINSPGGYVNDALAMYHSIQGHSAETYGYVIGSADSAASFVLQAMDHRVIAARSTMFIHRAQGLAIGDEDDAEAMRVLLHENTQAIASIYAERAGGTVYDWIERMSAGNNARRGTQYRGEEAVAVGLADDVGIPSRNRIPERVAALAGRVAAQIDIAPVIDFRAAFEAARPQSVAPTLQQLLEQHQKEPLTAAFGKGA